MYTFQPLCHVLIFVCSLFRLDELEKKISEVMLKVVKLSSMSNDGGSGGDRVSHLSSVLDVPSEQDRVELDIGGLCAAKSDWTNRWRICDDCEGIICIY